MTHRKTWLSIGRCMMDLIQKASFIPIQMASKWLKELLKKGTLMLRSPISVLKVLFHEITIQLAQPLAWEIIMEVMFKSRLWMIVLKEAQLILEIKQPLSWCNIAEALGGVHVMVLIIKITKSILKPWRVLELMQFITCRFLTSKKATASRDNSKLKPISQFNMLSLSIK